MLMSDETTITQLVGHNIRLARGNAGLSQGDIERSTGIRRTRISEWEHGHIRPSEPNLRRLADALDVPVLWFYQEHETA
jgi:transcriptional regulator with XRE-family HTH domain